MLNAPHCACTNPPLTDDDEDGEDSTSLGPLDPVYLMYDLADAPSNGNGAIIADDDTSDDGDLDAVEMV